MARRMTPGTLRAAMRTAITDDLWHGQPELEYRDFNRATPEGGVKKMYEVRGVIDPARLGTFGAQQIEGVIERTRPGLMAHVNGQPTEITQAELVTLLDEHGLPHDPYHEAQAAAILKLIIERTSYRPSFDDL